MIDNRVCDKDGFGTEVDSFILRLSENTVETPCGPISGIEWLTGNDPIANQIRCLSLILNNWPTPHAPWAMLIPLLRLATQRVVNPDACSAVKRCSFQYPRNRKSGGARCRDMSVRKSGRCDRHEGV